MATPAELYVRGIRKKLRYYYPAWLPNEILRLGDVGVLEGEAFFRRKTNLKRLGIKYKTIPDKDPTPFTLQSDKGVEVALKAAGEVNPKTPNIPQGKAGVAVDFSSTGAFLIRAPETYEPAICDIASLETQILELYKQGRWNKDWVVIVKLVTAPTATILISQSSAAKMELVADMQLNAGATVQLGDVGVKFRPVLSSGDIIDMHDATNITPFFQLIGIKRRWFRGDVIKILQVDIAPIDPFDEVTPALARDDERVASSLYVDLIWEPVREAEEATELSSKE